jgi:hypothetical protein
VGYSSPVIQKYIIGTIVEFAHVNLLSETMMDTKTGNYLITFFLNLPLQKKQ